MLLSRLLDGICEYTGEDMEIKAITSSAQRIQEGDCFVLLPGVFHDKSFLIHQAIEKNPGVIISENTITASIPSVRVKNAREVLAKILYRFYFHDDLPPKLIGITGTNGKSSVCHILSHLLKERYRVGVIGTQMIKACGKSLAPSGYTMTTPDPELLYPTLLKMKKMGCEVVVMEVSSHALALEKVSPLSFEIAVFTGLAEDHLDFHLTKEAYKSAKEKIFSLSHHAVLNTDCMAGQEYLARLKIPAVTVGKNCADYEVKNIVPKGLDGMQFVCRIDGEDCQITLPLLGEHNAFNAAYALCAAIKMGIEKKKAIQALEKITRIRGRLEVISEQPTVVLDYAHTPSSMEAVLKYIAEVKAQNAKTVVVFGAGGDRDRTKRPEMSKVAERYADFCVITTDNMRGEAQSQIFKDLKKGLRTKSHRFVTDRTKAIAYAYGLCQKQDVLVLLGKGHEDYILKKNQRVPYSELYALYLAQKGGVHHED